MATREHGNQGLANMRQCRQTGESRREGSLAHPAKPELAAPEQAESELSADAKNL
jgi:hypothetical protein